MHTAGKRVFDLIAHVHKKQPLGDWIEHVRICPDPLLVPCQCYNAASAQMEASKMIDYACPPKANMRLGGRLNSHPPSEAGCGACMALIDGGCAENSPLALKAVFPCASASWAESYVIRLIALCMRALERGANLLPAEIDQHHLSRITKSTKLQKMPGKELTAVKNMVEKMRCSLHAGFLNMRHFRIRWMRRGCWGAAHQRQEGRRPHRGRGLPTGEPWEGHCQSPSGALAKVTLPRWQRMQPPQRTPAPGG